MVKRLRVSTETPERVKITSLTFMKSQEQTLHFGVQINQLHSSTYRETNDDLTQLQSHMETQAEASLSPCVCVV